MNKLKTSDEYIRVTDVLFPFSGLKSIPAHVLQNAAERGTKVHEICEALISDLGTIPISPDLSGYIASFSKWAEDKKFVARPLRFYCDKYKITGEIDGLYKTEEGFTLFDIKTPATEGKTWSLQGSAYFYLATQAGYPITAIEFIQLSKLGYDAKVYSYKPNFELFLKCLEIYKLFFKDQKNNENDYL